MALKREGMDKYVGKKQQEGYVSAVREFTRMTIQDPSFFEKDSEEQVSQAREILAKNKRANTQSRANIEKL